MHEDTVCHLKRGTALDIGGHAAVVDRIGHDGVFVRLSHLTPPLVVEFNFDIIERAVFDK
jgi:hypothetical protein